jgi:phage replication-related protein YjqB (UPF0714/DUF867 family)
MDGFLTAHGGGVNQGTIRMIVERNCQKKMGVAV